MRKFSFIFVSFLIAPLSLLSQDTIVEKVVERPERPAFESSYIIDNPTDVTFIKNTLEVHMAHRFGVVNSGTNDLIGIWAPANIRIALSYAPHERLTLGFGTSKFNRLQDFNWKVALLRQTRSGSIPVNVTYYGNFVIDARGKENFLVEQHRYSYFNQLIVSRRFNSKLSLQGAVSVSHYNLVPQRMRNDVIAMSLGGRYKISSQTAILVDYTQPFIHHLDGAELDMDPEAGISVGVEFRTSSHAFQLFLSSYQGIVPQQNIMFNQNNFFEGDFLIGFNITRLYNF